MNVDFDPVFAMMAERAMGKARCKSEAPVTLWERRMKTLQDWVTTEHCAHDWGCRKDGARTYLRRMQREGLVISRRANSGQAVNKTEWKARPQ